MKEDQHSMNEIHLFRVKTKVANSAQDLVELSLGAEEHKGTVLDQCFDALVPHSKISTDR